MYTTISIAYLVENDEEFIKESYQSCSLIADEYIFLISKDSKDNSLSILTQLQKGDDRIHIFMSDENNDERLRRLLKYCTKEFIMLLKPYEVLSDNVVLIRNTLESCKDIEAFNINTNHYMYGLNKKDGTALQYLPIVRLIKNRDDLLINSGQISGFKEPLLNINNIIIHNYKALKGFKDFIDKHTTGITQDNISQFKNAFYNVTYTIQEVDLDEHPQIMKDKFNFKEWR